MAGTTSKDASGCAYIDRRVGAAWQLDGQVFAPDSTDDARFGSSVAFDGGRAVVGAPGGNRACLFPRIAAGNRVVDCVLGITCGAVCPCDWNHSGLLSVQDLFDFLACDLGGCP